MPDRYHDDGSIHNDHHDDKPRIVFLHTEGHYVVDGRRYNLVPAPEPVDLAALRDAAIDALLRADAARGTPYVPGSDDLCTAYESAARAWATAAGHRDA